MRDFTDDLRALRTRLDSHQSKSGTQKVMKVFVPARFDGGRARGVLGVSPDGSSNLVFADQSGNTRAGLGVDSRGLGTFTLADRSAAGEREELLDTLQMNQGDTLQPASEQAEEPAATGPERRRSRRAP